MDTDTDPVTPTEASGSITQTITGHPTQVNGFYIWLQKRMQIVRVASISRN